MLLDSQCLYVYAWTQLHKFFGIQPPFTATGPVGVKRMVELITPLVKGASKDPTNKQKQIFTELLHMAMDMDNLFSRNEVLQYLGEGGWKARMTHRHDVCQNHYQRST